MKNYRITFPFVQYFNGRVAKNTTYRAAAYNPENALNDILGLLKSMDAIPSPDYDIIEVDCLAESGYM